MTLKELPQFHRQRRHRASSSAVVNIHIRDLSQLFNSLDPSPFWDRDLDREAAAFIEEEFSEKLSAASWNLHVTPTRAEPRQRIFRRLSRTIMGV